ncbi:hypothetical protein ILYODFUR_019947 [Ilyodon furcidens]|uniref:Uncharacterized protein n=1 Tax=Ilyodon furcidens TaxID=33524 RepID=A0ABV0TCG9_9TELE
MMLGFAPKGLYAYAPPNILYIASQLIYIGHTKMQIFNVNFCYWGTTMLRVVSNGEAASPSTGSANTWAFTDMHLQQVQNVDEQLAGRAGPPDFLTDEDFNLNDHQPNSIKENHTTSKSNKKNPKKTKLSN